MKNLIKNEISHMQPLTIEETTVYMPEGRVMHRVPRQSSADWMKSLLWGKNVFPPQN